MCAKAVIFDWGGVLIDDPSHNIVECYAREFRVNEGVCREILLSYFGDFQKGMITEQELWERVCEHLPDTSASQVTPWIHVVRKTFFDKEDMHVFVKKLRQDGVKTGLLSNTEIPTTKYFFERKYDHLFDALVFSCDENLVKPDPQIYELAAKRLQVNLEECVFIDDKVEFVDGAKSVGMQGVLFGNTQQVIRDVQNMLSKNSL